MKKQLSLAVKVIVTLVLAVIGIMYIMNKSPRGEVRDYQKQAMPTSSSSRSSGGFFSDLSSSAVNGRNEDNDDISLTGKSRKYDEVHIGNSTDK